MIAREGLPFILPAWGVALIFLMIIYVTHNAGWLILFLPCALLAGLITYFFRDPNRKPPADELTLVSPADGKVILIEQVNDDSGNTQTLLSIFLSVFDVHVNRIPVSGQVTNLNYLPGKFHRAFEREAQSDNERMEITLMTPHGELKFSQVAGILARRIVCYLKLNDNVSRGDRFGLIRFGSRVDLYLESNIEVKVKLGDRVRGGVTVIGAYKQNG